MGRVKYASDVTDVASVGYSKLDYSAEGNSTMTRNGRRNDTRGAVAAALATRTTRTPGRRRNPIPEAGADPAAKVAAVKAAANTRNWQHRKDSHTP